MAIKNFARRRWIELVECRGLIQLATRLRARPLVAYLVGASGSLDTPYDCLRRRGAMQIVGFDPAPHECETAGMSVIPFAIGQRTEHRTLHVTRNPGCSSLLQPCATNGSFFDRPEWFDVVRTEQVTTHPLDQVAVENGLVAPDILQVDTQGFDLNVLRGADRILQGVAVVDVELHFRPLYNGQPLFHDIDRFLTDRGFVLLNLRPVRCNFSALVEADAAYLNVGLSQDTAFGRAKLAARAVQLRHQHLDAADDRWENRRHS